MWKSPGLWQSRVWLRLLINAKKEAYHIIKESTVCTHIGASLPSASALSRPTVSSSLCPSPPSEQMTAVGHTGRREWKVASCLCLTYHTWPVRKLITPADKLRETSMSVGVLRSFRRHWANNSMTHVTQNSLKNTILTRPRVSTRDDRFPLLQTTLPLIH